MAIGIRKPVRGRLCRFSVPLLLDPLKREQAAGLARARDAGPYAALRREEGVSQERAQQLEAERARRFREQLARNFTRDGREGRTR
jgi:hypothetical protein